MKPRILTIDIETRPHTVYAWGLHDQHVAINQIVEPGVILCFAAKWHDERGVMFHSSEGGKELRMLKAAHKLLTEADIVVGWNSDSFDLKWLNGQFVKHGLLPPEPYKKVDLLKTARAQFKVASNKLDYWAQYLGLGKKADTGGFDLWRGCMDGDPKAWRTMERYNRQDVRLTEKVYDRLGSWIKNHPNMALYTGTVCCPKCGGERLQRRQAFHTTTRSYAKFQCVTRLPTGGICGAWFRSTLCEPGSLKLTAVA